VKDGKIMKDDDDEKEELQKGIIMKAVHNIGGPLFWIFLFSSYIVMSIWGKYNDYKLKNMSMAQKEASDNGEDFNVGKNLGGFAVNLLTPMLLDMICDFAKLYIGSKFSTAMFKLIIKKVMNAPVNLYFDVTPMSKIMGYFTSDIDRCD